MQSTMAQYLDTLTIAELRELAAKYDVPLTGLTVKADIVEQIERTLPADTFSMAGTHGNQASNPTWPAVVSAALAAAEIPQASVEFWRLEADRLAVGHRQGGTLVGTKIVLTDEQVAELIDLDVTRGGRA